MEREYAGAFHYADVPYAFANLEVWQQEDWVDADRPLSNSILNAYVRFVQPGTPMMALGYYLVVDNLG
jgi:carboxylesterase type B